MASAYGTLYELTRETKFSGFSGPGFGVSHGLRREANGESHAAFELPLAVGGVRAHWRGSGAFIGLGYCSLAGCWVWDEPKMAACESSLLGMNLYKRSVQRRFSMTF